MNCFIYESSLKDYDPDLPNCIDALLYYYPRRFEIEIEFQQFHLYHNAMMELLLKFRNTETIHCLWPLLESV